MCGRSFDRGVEMAALLERSAFSSSEQPEAEATALSRTNDGVEMDTKKRRTGKSLA